MSVEELLLVASTPSESRISCSIVPERCPKGRKSLLSSLSPAGVTTKQHLESLRTCPTPSSRGGRCQCAAPGEAAAGSAPPASPWNEGCPSALEAPCPTQPPCQLPWRTKGWPKCWRCEVPLINIWLTAAAEGPIDSLIMELADVHWHVLGQEDSNLAFMRHKV